MFWVYILQCADATFYVGHTDCLEARIAQHQQGSFRSCYTFERRPLEIRFSQSFPTRAEALSAERMIKGWSRAKKTALIEGDWSEVSRLAAFQYWK